VIAPVSLGWHFKRADATAGYTIFVPTGRYSDGANDNTGLGMWGHELAMGTTYGFVKVNYQWETYAQTTTQGSELTILATFLMKPLKLPNP